MPGARMRRRKQAREEKVKMGDDEGSSAKLFDDDDAEEEPDSQLKVNKKERFEHNEKLKDRMRLKDLTKEFGSGSESSSTEEDEDAELLTPALDHKILETLARIKKGDAAIYKKDTNFFEDGEGEEDDGKNEKSKAKKKKKLTVTDLERQRLMRGEAGASDEEEEEGPISYPEEQKRLKSAFKEAEASEESEDDLFVPRRKTREDEVKEEQSYKEFEKEMLSKKNPSETLLSLLKDDNIDDDERFLRNYVLGNEWKTQEDEAFPTYNAIVGVNDSEDEEEVERADKFEEAYNFRFEEPGAETVKGHAREVEGSLRRKDERRKEKRKRKDERELSMRERQKEELKRLKNEKKKEIMERLALIQNLSGAPHVDASKVDLDKDFDPEEHEKQMQAIYDEEYYEQEGDEKHPFAEEGTEEFLEAIGYEEEEGEGEWGEEDGGWGGEEGEDGGWGGEEEGGKKDRKKSRAELRKEAKAAKKKEKGGVVPPSGEEMEEIVQKEGKEGYLDEYYQLDYEGMIGDMPTRFKYRETDKVDYGLTPEEILLMDDKDLRQVMPMSLVASPFKPAPSKLIASLRYKARKLAAKIHDQEGRSIRERGGHRRGEGGKGESKSGKGDKERKRPREEEGSGGKRKGKEGESPKLAPDRMASYKAHKKEEIKKKEDEKKGFEKKWKNKEGGKDNGEDERDKKRQRKYAEAHRKHAGEHTKDKKKPKTFGDQGEDKTGRHTSFFDEE